MTTPKLSPVEVVAWLKQQAKAYNDAADAIESTLAIEPRKNGSHATKEYPVDPTGRGFFVVKPDELTPESLLRRIRTKSARVKDIAKEYQVSEDRVWELVNAHGSGVRLAERGWIKALLAKEQVEGE